MVVVAVLLVAGLAVGVGELAVHGPDGVLREGGRGEQGKGDGDDGGEVD